MTATIERTQPDIPAKNVWYPTPIESLALGRINVEGTYTLIRRLSTRDAAGRLMFTGTIGELCVLLCRARKSVSDDFGRMMLCGLMVQDIEPGGRRPRRYRIVDVTDAPGMKDVLADLEPKVRAAPWQDA